MKNNLKFLIGCEGLFLLCLIFVYRMNLSPDVLSIEVVSPGYMDTYQVFYDIGRGFNEKDSLTAIIYPESKTAVVHFFGFPAQKIRTFRVDPGTQMGHIQIKSILVQYELLGIRIPLYAWKGKSLIKNFRPLHDLAEFRLTDQGLTMMSAAGPDPYFVFCGNRQAVQAAIARTASRHKIILNVILLLLISGIALVYKKREAIHTNFQRVERFFGKNRKIDYCLQVFVRIDSRLDRFHQRRPKVTELFFLLLIVCAAVNTLGANPFKGKTVAPTDLLLMNSASAGFKSIQQHIPIEQRYILYPVRSDIIDSQIPAWKNIKTLLRTGKDVRWNPTRAGGMTGIQNLAGSYFTPSFWLFCAFQDDALGYYFAVLINLIIAGVGTFFLLRIVVSAVPAFFGAVIFMLSGPMIGWFFWPHVLTAIWLPWLLWTTLMYLERSDPRWLPGITLAGVFLILGGFPAIAAFSFYAFALLVGLWNLLSFRTAKSIFVYTAFPLIAVGLAFVISGIALLPFVEFSKYLDILGPRNSGTYFNGWSELRFFVNTIISPRAVYPEGICYVGMLAIFFCIAGLIAIGMKKATRAMRLLSLYAAVLSIISISFAFGLLPHAWIRIIPVFDKNLWSRLTFVTVLAIAILAGIGFEILFRGIHTLIARGGDLKYGSRLSQNKMACSKLIVLIGMVCFLWFQFNDQKTLFRHLNAITPAEWFYPKTASIRYVAQNLGPLQYIISDNAYFNAGTLGAYELSDWYAHAFHSPSEKELLGQLVAKPFKTLTASVFTAEQIQFEYLKFDTLIDVLGIKFIMINSHAQAASRLQEKETRWNVLQLEDDVTILERKKPINGAYHVYNLQQLPTEEEWKEMGTGLDISRKSTTEFVCQNTGNHAGWVVFPMRSYPGWAAYIDNRKVPVEKYLKVFPAVKVQGPCEIRYKYEPKSLKYGILISGIGIVVWLGFVLATCKKQEWFK